MSLGCCSSVSTPAKLTILLHHAGNRTRDLWFTSPKQKLRVRYAHCGQTKFSGCPLWTPWETLREHDHFVITGFALTFDVLMP